MSPYRRTILSTLPALLIGSAGCTTSAVDLPGETTPDDCEASTLSGDLALLGDFEEGLDGWTTSGEHEPSRVTAEAVPRGVASGEHALAVRVRGEAVPTLANEERARRADFVGNPYLHLHVQAVATDTDADLEFRARLLHGDDCGGDGGGPRSADGLDVVESDPVTVPQLDPRRIQWDTSTFPEEVLRTTRRLEISWRPAGDDGGGGDSSAPSGEADVRQVVVIDDVRLSEDEPVGDARRLQRTRTALNREHGAIVDRETDVLNETFERGRFEYADGYTVNYTYELLDEDPYRSRYTLDGETFYLGNAPR